MRILTVNVLYAPYRGGGAEIIMQSLNEGFVLRGHEVFVVTFTDKSSSTDEEMINGVRVVRKKIPNFYLPGIKSTNKMIKLLWHVVNIYNPISRQLLKEEIKKIKPDVVIFHNTYGWSAAVLSVPAKFNIPSIQVLHDLHFVCAKNMFRNNRVCTNVCFRCKLMQFPYRYGSNRIQAVVGVSEFILNKVLQYGYFSRTKIKQVIYNVRDGKNFRMQQRPFDGEVVFGFIGTIAPNKGIENLLRAFVDLEDNFALCIAGKGAAEYEEYLQQKYSHGKITWLGYINQEDFFSRIDVLVVPSIWYENLPTVIIEACNHGIPVIASNIGGIPELVKDGVNGFLCEYNNIEDLKKKMVHISGEINQWKKKALEIRKSATPFLNYDGWIVQWEKLILHVIHSN